MPSFYVTDFDTGRTDRADAVTKIQRHCSFGLYVGNNLNFKGKEENRKDNKARKTKESGKAQVKRGKNPRNFERPKEKKIFFAKLGMFYQKLFF